MKRISLVLLVLVLLMNLSIIPAFAAERDDVQPLYNNIATIVVGLEINKNTGIAISDGAVDAYYQVPVEVLVQLQMYKNGQWKTVMSWSNSGIGTAYAGGQYVVEPGYNYRTRVTGSICNDFGIPVESEVGTKDVYYPAS